MTFEEVLKESSDKQKIYEFVSDMLDEAEGPEAVYALKEILEFIDEL